MKYEKDEIVRGRVTGIEKYGVFVSLDEYYSGLIHISEISHNFVKNISDYVQVGETIYAKILNKDDETNHVKLSIKDIEYRRSPRRREKIEETKSGFKNLEKNLEKWVEDKLKEMEK